MKSNSGTYGSRKLPVAMAALALVVIAPAALAQSGRGTKIEYAPQIPVDHQYPGFAAAESFAWGGADQHQKTIVCQATEDGRRRFDREHGGGVNLSGVFLDAPLGTEVSSFGFPITELSAANVAKRVGHYQRFWPGRDAMRLTLRRPDGGVLDFDFVFAGDFCFLSWDTLAKALAPDANVSAAGRAGRQRISQLFAPKAADTGGPAPTAGIERVGKL